MANNSSLVVELKFGIIDAWYNIHATVFQILLNGILHHIFQVIHTHGEILPINNSVFISVGQFLTHLFICIQFFPDQVEFGGKLFLVSMHLDIDFLNILASFPWICLVPIYGRKPY